MGKWVGFIALGLVTCMFLASFYSRSAPGEVFAWFIVVCLYFLPTLVSRFNKNCASPSNVFLVNLLFGWTGLGWIVAFIMSVWERGGLKQNFRLSDPKLTFVCVSCGSQGEFSKTMPGSGCLCFILFLMGGLPGVLYLTWRLINYKWTCSACKGSNVIPVDSPMGKELSEKYSGSAK